MSLSAEILTASPPQLRDGERLDQKTFHELYKQTPPDFKAELIGGVVHVASPRKVPHGNHHAVVVGWLWLYHVSTPGTRVRDNATTILDDSNEPQPDAALVIESEFGGQSTVDADDFAVGAPELVVEVADTTLKTDLTKKLPEYEQTGVREYIVVAIPTSSVRWFQLGESGYEEQTADNGVFRSSVFPRSVAQRGCVDGNGLAGTRENARKRTGHLRARGVRRCTSADKSRAIKPALRNHVFTPSSAARAGRG